jgi:hypothetical protein
MGRTNKLNILILIAIVAISSLLFIQPAKAEVENVSTSCGIFVDSIVEGQPITIGVQIFPAPPSGETFNNLFVWITSPMQGVSGYGPWDKSNITTDTDGKATVTFDIHTFSGYWNVGLYFGGQYFANNTIYYQPGNWQRGFSISSAQTPTPLPVASPSPSPSPTSTPNSTTNKPTSTENNPTGSNNALSIATLALIIVIAILAGSAVSLLLYRRHRH